MIILDSDDQVPEKVDRIDGSRPTVRLPDRASLAGRSIISLPDYETSQALHIDFRKPSRRKRLARRRFWKGVIIGMAIYVFVTIGVGVPLLLKKFKKKNQPYGSPWDDDGDDPSLNLVIKPGMFDMDSSTYPCDQWKPGPDPFSSIASHSLRPSGSLYLRSNVSFDATQSQGISGSFNFTINPDPSAQRIQASVQMQASSQFLANRTHICFMDDDNSNRGFTLYVPDTLMFEDYLRFKIDFVFPQIQTAAMKDLFTTLSMFDQHFGDLGNDIAFNNVVIQGYIGEVTCGSMNANQVAITSSLGPVTGFFAVNQELDIDNIGGSIDVDATMVHRKSRKSPTSFSLNTGNSEINANITLLGDKASDNTLLGFTGQVKNFNGNVAVNVGHHPASQASPLNMHVGNSAGYSQVSLGPLFSGFFSAQTKIGKVMVDPTNSTRIQWSQSRTPTQARGWYGGNMPKSYTPNVGLVEIVSSLNDVRLDFLSSFTGPTETFSLVAPTSR